MKTSEINSDLKFVLDQVFPKQYEPAMQRLYDRAIQHLDDSIVRNIETHLFDAGVLFGVNGTLRSGHAAANHPLAFIKPDPSGYIDAPDVPDALSWAQYFALNALHELSFVIFCFRFGGYNPKDFDPDDPDQAEPGVQESINALVDATDSLGIADRLSEYAQSDSVIASLIEKKAKSKLSQRNRLAAQTRHNRNRPIKQRFVEYYHSLPKGAVKKHAAQAFVKSLKTEDIKLLGGEEPVRTLLKHLNKIG